MRMRPIRALMGLAIILWSHGISGPMAQEPSRVNRNVVSIMMEEAEKSFRAGNMPDAAAIWMGVLRLPDPRKEFPDYQARAGLGVADFLISVAAFSDAREVVNRVLRLEGLSPNDRERAVRMLWAIDSSTK